MAVVVRVSSFEINPVEFALADSTGSVKGIWYMGPQVSKKEMEELLVEDGGVFITNFKVGRNVVICGSTSKIRQ